MKLLNTLSALLVLVCAVYISVNHTHDLFMGVGYTSRQAWVATIMSETMFIVGGINLAAARLRGYKPGTPAYLGFIQGVALVGWSNIAATYKYGIDGWLLGSSIVSAVLIMEAIMTNATKKADENAEQEPEEKAENDQPKKPTARPDRHDQPEQPDHPNHPTTQREQTDQPTNQPEQPTAQPEDNDKADQPDETAQVADTAQTNQADETNQDVAKSEESAQPLPTAQAEATNRPTNNNQPTNQPGGTAQPEQPEEVTDQPTDQPTGATQTTQNDETAQADGIEETDQTDKPTTPYEWAVHEYKRTGKVPTRRGLAKLAGCSEWKAGNAKKQLEEELGLAG
ncbi:hypothetical protein CLV36_11255 [Laceyella sediminis]|uniref:Uncharacterized protein n=1 Tax=Laceyella sediminis TaxID=573074 RepID=A0ABX5ENB3_9BACL|nr:hypothetical protein [Laceyella sediminis]PRZ12658.1 hypothetical protein CLV36_11255 [Laceyella sediminis]